MFNKHLWKLLKLIVDLGNVLYLSAFQQALPALLGPVKSAAVGQSWESHTKFQEPLTEAEASASLGEDPNPQSGKEIYRSQSQGYLELGQSRLLPVAWRPIQALRMNSCGL